MEQPLTDREQKLIDFINVLIQLVTAYSIIETKITELLGWRTDVAKSIGATREWQDNMISTLEKDFGTRYKKVNTNLEYVEEDGDKTN